MFYRRGFRIGDIEPAAVLDPGVLALASRFDVRIDQTLAGKFTPATVAVRLRKGTELRATVHSIPGTPKDPLSNEQVVNKAAACFASGPNALGEQRAAALMSRIDRLESIVSMRDFWNF